MENNHHNQQLYTCPMHPEIVKNEPGSCPRCGMNLIPVDAKEKEHSQLIARPMSCGGGSRKPRKPSELFGRAKSMPWLSTARRARSSIPSRVLTIPTG